MGVDLSKFFLLSFFIFIIAILLIFLYTQFAVEKKRMTIINSKGEKINLLVEVASDPFKRTRGLMFRQALGENEGMLFVFDKPNRYGFWMVNTTIALDAVFFDENKRVVDIAQMHPCKTLAEQCKVYYPKKAAKYVLEANLGFAEKNGIEENCSFDFN